MLHTPLKVCIGAAFPVKKHCSVRPNWSLSNGLLAKINVHLLATVESIIGDVIPSLEPVRIYFRQTILHLLQLCVLGIHEDNGLGEARAARRTVNSSQYGRP